MVEELVDGAMVAADAAAAAVAADLEAARRKQLAERKRQRKRERDRCFHKKRTNKRKNMRRSEWRKARTQTRAQMAPVLSQLLHLGRSRQACRPTWWSQVRTIRRASCSQKHSIALDQCCEPYTCICRYICANN